MAGLENLACTTFTQPFQQNKRAKDQVRSAPQKELIDLVSSQPAALDELSGQGSGIRTTFRHTIEHELLELIFIEEMALANRIDQVCDRGYGGLHAGLAPPNTRRMTWF